MFSHKINLWLADRNEKQMNPKSQRIQVGSRETRSDPPLTIQERVYLWKIYLEIRLAQLHDALFYKEAGSGDASLETI